MTIDERLETLGIRIEGLVMNAELANREIEAWRESTRRATEEIHSIIRGLAVRHEALIQRHEALTQRHEALTMNSELMGRDIEALRDLARQDGENIRALARIAEMHEGPSK